MQRKELEDLFDQQATSYDEQWSRLSAIREAMLLLASARFADLPDNARILCVGAGTGAEIINLAQRFPGYRFVAVEPSAQMVEVCRRNMEENGLLSRCELHHGYVETLSAAPFDAATSILVSQFMLDRQERSGFFRAIAERLRPGGYLVSAYLSANITSPAYQSLLSVWLRMMKAGEVSADMIDKIRHAYENDVAVLPPDQVAEIMKAGGFDTPVQFFQAGLIHAWYTTAATP